MMSMMLVRFAGHLRTVRYDAMSDDLTPQGLYLICLYATRLISDLFIRVTVNHRNFGMMGMSVDCCFDFHS
jgi:hypothetical protein